MRLTDRFLMSILAVVALAFVIATGPAGAQAPQGPPPPGPGMFDAFGFQGFQGGLGGKTVTSSPFSATYSVQTTQTLSDGNQIQRNNTGSLARDSQGRTRRDMTLSGIGPLGSSGQGTPRAVFISDNVASTQYILDPNKKIATKMQRRPRGNSGSGGPPPSGQGGPPSFGGPRGQGQKDVVTTSLGTQTINGVLAEGTRYTRTVPVGAIGNQNPIVITTERWYSTDLQTVVLTKRTDPRMGETISQLTNIQRNEPDPTLFQVPSDYTIKQGGGPGGGRKGRGPNGGGANITPAQ